MTYQTMDVQATNSFIGKIWLAVKILTFGVLTFIFLGQALLGLMAAFTDNTRPAGDHFMSVILGGLLGSVFGYRMLRAMNPETTTRLKRLRHESFVLLCDMLAVLVRNVFRAVCFLTCVYLLVAFVKWAWIHS